MQQPVRQPRAHHYIFGHVLLPQALFRDPGFLLKVGRDQRLLSLWHQAGVEAPIRIARGGAPFEVSVLAPSGLQCTLQDPGARTAVVVEMPKAERPTEVIYAVAIAPEPRRGLLGNRHEHARYFVLEWSEAMGSVPATRWAEWAPEGRKLFGFGPPRFEDGGFPLVAAMIQMASELDPSKPLMSHFSWIPFFMAVLDRDFKTYSSEQFTSPLALRQLLRSTFVEMVGQHVVA